MPDVACYLAYIVIDEKSMVIRIVVPQYKGHFSLANFKTFYLPFVSSVLWTWFSPHLSFLKSGELIEYIDLSFTKL